MRKYNIGIIGSGAISKAYLDTFTESCSSVLNVRSICSRHFENAEKKAKEYNIKAAVLDEMLNDPDIDIVVNLTPVGVHAEIIGKALEHGKNVYSEKTLSVNVKDAEALIKKAKEKGVSLCCAPDTFLSAGVQTVRRLLNEGAIGSVTGFHMQMNRNYGEFYEKLPFLLLPDTGGGMDIGPYFLCCLTYLLGSVGKVCGFADISRPVRDGKDGGRYNVCSENRFAAAMVLRNGIPGTLQINADNGASEDPAILIYGTEGTIKLKAPNKFCKEVCIDTGKGFGEAELDNGVVELRRGLGVAEMAVSLEQGMVPMTDAVNALHCLEVIRALYRSSETGRTVGIDSEISEETRRAFDASLYI